MQAQLATFDGVLVWVNPIHEGRNRAKLDALLREVAARGVWVSAHPDVILKMGTKEVLHRTRTMSWGCDTVLYRIEERKFRQRAFYEYALVLARPDRAHRRLDLLRGLTCATITAWGDAYFVEGIVTLIVYYVVFMIVGDFAAYFLGLFTEYEWGSQVSLIVFLALYFLFLWVSWVLAVRVTKPKTAEQQSS